MRASDADTGMRTGLEVGAGVATLTQGTGRETQALCGSYGEPIFLWKVEV